MWEHKHEVLKDDSLRSDAETSREESEKETEVNESSKKEEKSIEEKDKENALEGKSDNVPRDQNNTRVSRETRENDAIGAVNGQTENEQEIKVNSNSSSVEDDKTTSPSGNSNQISTRLNVDRAREGSDETRINDISARDEKRPAVVNDVQAREGTRNAESTARTTESTLGSSNNDTEINNMKYTGVDKAFVNLLEEVEDDQTFFEEQLEKLEKQVESEYNIREIKILKSF